MKFLLHEGLGYSTIRRIGDYLRAHGSGHHWIEKYRGDIFVDMSDDRDEAVLRDVFPNVLDPVASRSRSSGSSEKAR
jgi:hypothetical protein